MMKRLFVLLPLLIVFTGIFLSSCVVTDPPRAVVTVIRVDANDVKWPVPNCEVRLDIPEGANQPDLLEFAKKAKLTDINGQVEYEFKYEGIIPIVAQKGDGAESCGSGVIILKENEVYQVEIRLSACENI
ncbi:MAG: hypothetical protein K9H64_14555 [Bacteroidales bacterium]|nr:hypothetical protein [Bacteroidales bacterium]MCF8457204.1 hypothetical protein [Bacteroidales bacterium]